MLIKAVHSVGQFALLSSHFRELAGGILRISADEIYKRCYATFIFKYCTYQGAKCHET